MGEKLGINKLGQKFCKKLGKKFGKKIWQKNWAKNWVKSWAKNRQKCDHTNSGRQFVVIEFTNLVEFMNVIK